MSAAQQLLAEPRPHPVQDVPSVPVLSVDLTAVAANTRLFAEITDGALMAVVKADGFGHGAVAVARTALANGATWLGVTSLAEALALRYAGVTAPVLSWLNPVDLDAATASRHDVDLAVSSLAHLDTVALAAAVTGRSARVHLHLDTGMARDGAAPAQWARLCARARLAERCGLVRVVGVMGHLGCADRVGDACNERGRAAFDAGLEVARRSLLRPRTNHLAATAATLLDRRTHHDLSRVGAGLVGIDPTRTTVLRPALTLTAPVVSVRGVPSGTPVGYGHTHLTSRSTTLALLPIGYADGIPRTVSGAEVLLAGRRCPVVGRVSMDQVVVDVGPSPRGVRPGDVAVVFGPGDHGEPTVREWAGWSGTIENEIVTGIGARVARCWR